MFQVKLTLSEVLCVLSNEMSIVRAGVRALAAFNEHTSGRTTLYRNDTTDKIGERRNSIIAMCKH